MAEHDTALTPQQRGAAITNGGHGPIASLQPAEREQMLTYVLQRAYQDKRLADVAAEIGVHKTSLSAALIKYREEEWRELQVARALMDFEDAEIELEQARDVAAVHRARERSRTAQFRLERLYKRLFGADTPSAASSTSVTINIGELRTKSEPQVIDSTGSATVE